MLVVLCLTQITSWGILYYAFPVMLTAVTTDTRWTTSTALGAYSVGLLASAVAAPVVGRLIDRHGPRPVMTIGSVLGVLSMVGVAAAHQLVWFFAAWVLVGLAQSAVLYPPAFAAITGWFGAGRVRAITTVTLVGGLASTVFAPLTAGLLHFFDWRQTLVVLGLLLGAITIPLHWFGLRMPWPGRRRPAGTARRGRTRMTTIVRSRPFVLFAVALMLGGFGLYGATLNLMPLLADRGIGTGAGAVIFGLVGVGQLAGRFCYPMLDRRTGPRSRTTAVIAAGALCVAVLAVLPGSVAAFAVVAVAAGAARGIMTLLQATGVSDRWGTRDFGTLNGIATAPATAAIVAAPAVAAVLVDLTGTYTVAYLVLAGVCLLGAAAAFGTRTAPAGLHQ